MDKLENVVISPAKEIKIQFQDIDVVISPYITFKQELILIKQYVESLFQKNEDGKIDVLNYVSAKMSLILGIVDMCTNISIGEDVEVIVSSGLWDKVRAHILNYNEVMDDIDSTVEIMFKDSSLETKIALLLDTINDLGKNAKNIDFAEVKKFLEELQKPTARPKRSTTKQHEQKA